MSEHYASYDDEELVSAGPDQRNWTGIGIALLVIVAFSSVILTAVFLLTPDLTARASKRKLTKLTLEDILPGGPLEPRHFNGTWISDREFVFRDAEGSLVLYDAENVTKVKLMSNIPFRQYDVHFYSLSPDRRYVLMGNNPQKVSEAFPPRAQYFCYNLSNELEFPLFEDPVPFLQYISWGTHGSQLVYVYENNVYYRPNVSAPSIQLSVSGGPAVSHGVPEAAYLPGIPQRSSAIWWIDEGTRLAFASYNATAVHPTTIPRLASSVYDSIRPPEPRFTNLRYPKPGEKKPTVSLWVVDLIREEFFQVLPPLELRKRFHYLTSVSWINNGSLLVTWMTEEQNRTLVTTCDWKVGWSCQVNYEVEAVEGGWLPWKVTPAIGNGLYAIRVPIVPETLVKDNPKGFAMPVNQVALVNITTGEARFLTKSENEVLEILALDVYANKVYYLARLARYPGEHHLFSVSIADGTLQCITCHIGPSCKFNQVHFSHPPRYYVLDCKGPDPPLVALHSTVKNHARLDVLDQNDGLRNRLSTLLLPEIQTFLVPLRGNHKASVRIYIPPLRSDEEIEKFPLIIELSPEVPFDEADSEISGGLVTAQHEVHVGLFLSTARKYVYARVDLRGRPPGELRGRLGTVDVNDHLAVAKYLREQLPFVDPEKTVLWGQGYGGYVAAMAAASQPKSEHPLCAIAVSPITDWHYYGAVYTERYMGRKEDNDLEYQQASLLHNAEGLRGKKFLLVHGTADENVHFQHSTMLMKALNDKGILYRTQVYPDQGHRLETVRRHLYRTMEYFLKTSCFVKTEPPEAEQFHKLIFGK